MTDTLSALTPALALAYWRKALANEVGLRFACKQVDTEKIQTLMYTVRKSAPDYADLKDLMLCVGPGNEEMWIVKRPKEAP